ncbi:MAG: Ig-like domain-containing protein, partial [Nanoarchaeota archaeon]|nr:Ig-like domain-containing protein [Nanoarchaeota archaeon]
DNCGGTIDCSSCLGDLSYCSEGICVECISADDCEDDGIACTVESCENNQCVHDTSSCLDINLDPENASIEPGEQLIYRTLLYYGNGTSRENISGAIYTSSDEGIVSIDNNIVEGVTEGTVTITVSYTEDYGGGELTVNDSVQLDVVAEGSSYLSHIEISPEESTIQIGSTQPYTVTAYYSGGSSEDVSDVAFLMSLDGIVASTMIAEGVGATGMQEGVATILASYGVIYDEENHTIKEDSAVLHVACVDGDSDGVCDWDEPEGCSVQNVNNLPANTSCLYYYGFNTLTGCWISGFYEGKICGSTEEYACSDDLSKIEKRTYSLECSVGGCTKPSYDTTVVVEETCVTIEECDGPVNSTELGDYECDCRVDSDNDDVCEDYRGTAGKDDCIGQAPSGGAPSIPTEYTSQCNQYEFSYTTGCWELKHINVDVPFVSENCTEAICYEDTSVYMKCNLEGKEIPHSEGCDQMIENCGGDPDFSKENCTLYFSKSDDDIICQDHEWNCWSKHTASTYLGGDSYCCGDDGSEECWIDAADNACCWSNLLEKVAYLSDPDESVIYCGLLGEKLGAFNAVNCDEGETYCWDPVSRQCCGDDEDETWEYSTSRKLGDVLVNETCYGGRWVVVWREETTYFDLWSLFMKIFE